jgi:hypothetical protein
MDQIRVITSIILTKLCYSILVIRVDKHLYYTAVEKTFIHCNCYN